MRHADAFMARGDPEAVLGWVDFAACADSRAGVAGRPDRAGRARHGEGQLGLAVNIRRIASRDHGAREDPWHAEGVPASRAVARRPSSWRGFFKE